MKHRAEVCKGTKYAVQAQANWCGNDLSVSITGGTLAHIGAVSLACYEAARDSATVSTITVFSHRDDHVSSMVAKLLSSTLKCTVSVSAGIHIDNASNDEVDILSENCLECCEKLLSELQSSKS